MIRNIHFNVRSVRDARIDAFMSIYTLTVGDGILMHFALGGSQA